MRSVIVAACVAFVLTLFGTPFAIRGLARLKAAQPIRDINTSHAGKRGTPTMGGVFFIVGTVIAYFAGHLVLNTLPEQQIAPPGPTITGLVLLGLMVFSGAIGFIDDYLKVRKRNSLGLNKRGKLILQLLVGAVFGVVALYFPATNGETVGSTHVSFIRDIRWMDIGKVGVVVLFLAVVMATTNAVNLTDGLDGLATGACVGFLWWNASPARIFMGDTGSMALGGLIAGMAMATRTELLLLVLGLLFVIITMSLIIQIVSFRTTGKRVFRMSPLHHHFELAGWSEVNIVIRFWIIAGIGVAVGLGMFYGDFLRVAG